MAPNNAAAIAQRKIKWPLILPRPSVKLFRRLQLGFESTEWHPASIGSGWSQLSHLILRGPPHGDETSSSLAPHLHLPYLDLSHADILVDQCEVSILNVVVMIEYSTLEGAPTQRMLTYC